MTHTLLSGIFSDWWQDICCYVNVSLVFMDDEAAECLHWHGGLHRLMEHGAIGVRNFSISEKASFDVKRAVFIISSPFTDVVSNTLIAIVRNSNFKNCTVITSISEHFYDGDLSEHSSMFSIMERNLLNWMGNINCTARVIYSPCFAAYLSSNVFIMPAFSKRFSPVSSEFFLFQALKDSTDHTVKSLPSTIQTNIKMLVSCLTTLIESLEAKCDVFSVGPLSHLVGSELENSLQSFKKKTLPTKASLLLFDRSLDLAGPLSQNCSTMIGKMLKTLPHLPGHTCDIAVNMSDLETCMGGDVFGLPLLAPGCLAHKNSNELNMLNVLFTKKIKDATMEANRKLVQIGVSEGLSFDKNAPKALKKTILSFKAKTDVQYKHNGLLQQMLAIVQALESSKNPYLDNLLATEKLLMQNLSISRDGAGDDIARLISHRKDRGYKLVDVLTFIAFLYALCEDDILVDEAKSSLQATIIEALFQTDDNETSDLLKKIVEDEAEDQDILASVKIFFNVLERFGTLRKKLKKYKSIFNESENPALPATYNPLLKQILEDIFKSSEVQDLDYHSAGLGDFIRAGFGLFVNVKKPQPKDNPILIIIVLGGITDSEIKMINEVSNVHKTPKIFLGTTNILTPMTVMNDLFKIVRNTSKSDLYDE